MEQNNNTRRVISLLVDNSNGVLARISSLFCRRGFNIDSLTVSATNDPSVSRITVTLRGTEQALHPPLLPPEKALWPLPRSDPAARLRFQYYMFSHLTLL